MSQTGHFPSVDHSRQAAVRVTELPGQGEWDFTVQLPFGLIIIPFYVDSGATMTSRPLRNTSSPNRVSFQSEARGERH